MSALGQKQTCGSEVTMSALPPKADIPRRECDVRYVPKADIDECMGHVRFSFESGHRAAAHSGIGGNRKKDRRLGTVYNGGRHPVTASGSFSHTADWIRTLSASNDSSVPGGLSRCAVS
jgi:hypothetical protein